MQFVRDRTLILVPVLDAVLKRGLEVDSNRRQHTLGHLHRPK
jgi:hypothetical protein